MADMSYTNVSGVQMSLRLPDHTDNICISQLVTCNTGPVVTDSQRMFCVYVYIYT